MSLRRLAFSVGSFVAGALLAMGLTFPSFRGLERQYRSEVEATLALHLEALARVRSGRPESGIELIEKSVNNAIQSLSLSMPWEAMDTKSQQALLQARKYRSVVAGPDDAVWTASLLARIPETELDWGSCRPALREFLEKNELDRPPVEPQQD